MHDRTKEHFLRDFKSQCIEYGRKVLSNEGSLLPHVLQSVIDNAREMKKRQERDFEQFLILLFAAEQHQHHHDSAIITNKEDIFTKHLLRSRNVIQVVTQQKSIANATDTAAVAASTDTPSEARSQFDNSYKSLCLIMSSLRVCTVNA